MLTDDILDAHLGRQWRQARPVTLSFSRPEFRLMGLGDGEDEEDTSANSKTPSKNGLLALSRSKLKHLDLSNNLLTTPSVVNTVCISCGFTSLLELRLANNRLTSPFVLRLPMLRLLDLSDNALTLIPETAYVCSLRNLDLARNKIQGSLASLTRLTDLEFINLRENLLDFSPNQFVEELGALGLISKLTAIDLSQNPFTNWFPEYQHQLIIKLCGAGGVQHAANSSACLSLKKTPQHAGPPLRWLDGVEFKEAQVAQLAKTPLPLPMARYNELYFANRAVDPVVQRAVDDVQSSKTICSGQATLEALTGLIRQSLLDSRDAVAKCAELQGHCARIAGNVDTLQRAELWRGIETSKQAQAAQVVDFIQAAQLIVVRCEKVMPVVLRSLGHLSTVPSGTLATTSLQSLGKLMQSSRAAEAEEAIEIVGSSVVPALRAKWGKRGLSQAVVEGVAEYSPNVADCLQGLVLFLVDMLEETPDDRLLCRTLAVACRGENGRDLAISAGAPQLLCHALIYSTEVASDPRKADTYAAMLDVIGSCAHHSAAAAALLWRRRLPERLLIPSLKKILGYLKPTERLSVQQSKTAAALMRTLVAIVGNCQQALHQLMSQYAILDLFLIPPKEHRPNPCLLPPALDGICVVLSDSALRDRFLETTTKDLQDLQQLLKLWGGSSYAPLCRAAEHTLKGNNDLPYVPEVPALESLTNRHVQMVFEAIARLLILYLQGKEGQCRRVTLGGNSELPLPWLAPLLRVLRCNFPTVRIELLRCLEVAPIEAMDEVTVLELVRLLRTAGTVFTVCHLEVSLHLIRLLTRVIDNKGQCLEILLANEVADSVLEAIHCTLKNALRCAASETIATMASINTELAIACTCFLGRASVHRSLRGLLRTPRTIEVFQEIVKAEEWRTVKSPHRQDIPVERTWTGRSAAMVLKCLSASFGLQADGRVAFRLLGRLADTLQGRSEAADSNDEDLQIKALCKRESDMWNVREMQRNLYYLDETEAEDRRRQIEEFVRLGGPENISIFLVKLGIQDYYKRHNEERKNNTDAAYWAGRLKGDKKTMEYKLARQTVAPLATDAAVVSEHGSESDDGSEAVKLSALPPEVFEDLDNPDDVETRDQKSRMVFLTAMQEEGVKIITETTKRLDVGDIFLYDSDTIYNSGGQGGLLHRYIVTSFLRCLFVAIVLPTSKVTQQTVRQTLQHPRFLRRITGLVESCACCGGYLLAKYLRLMTCAVTFQPHQAVESMDLLLPYDIVCNTLRRVAPLVRHLVKQALLSEPLTKAEQVFCSEIVTFLSVIARQTPYIKFSDFLVVQRHFVQEAFVRFFPKVFLDMIADMITYDAHLEAGSTHGTYVSHLTTRSAAARENMVIRCIEALSELMVNCPNQRKFDALEAVYRAKIFRRAPLHRSLLFDMIDRANCSRLAISVELRLSELYDRAERVILCCPVWWWTYEDHHRNARSLSVDRAIFLTPGILVLTTFSYYIFTRPPGLRDSENPDDPMNIDEPPTILIQREYKSMTRLCRGFPNAQQWIGVGWLKKDMKPGLPVYYESWDIIICDNLGCAERLLESLRALSARKNGTCPDVIKDVVTRETLKHHLKIKNIRQCSFVISQAIQKDSKESVDHVNYEIDTPKDPYLALHILTPTSLYEFVVDWRYWFSFNPEDPDDADRVRFDDEYTDDEIQLEHAALRATIFQLDNFLGFTKPNDAEPDDHDDAAVDHQVPKSLKDTVAPPWVLHLLGKKTDDELEDEALGRLPKACKWLLKRSFRLRLEDLRDVSHAIHKPLFGIRPPTKFCTFLECIFMRN
eukprot:GHVT01050007.1.p1 GENE.GHVT01050007.1~~GHVT01050007.1.p1  ORF type:complete len:1797 (-),score=162.03 GHVT01050007.1:859-6249(-)